MGKKLTIYWTWRPTPTSPRGPGTRQRHGTALAEALKRALANKTKLSELFRPCYSISHRTRGGAHFRETQTAILHALRGKPKAVTPAPSAELDNKLFIGA
jgi:hypothetical protein